MDEVNKRFESMAALIDEASLLLDAQSIVVQANEKALMLLGNYIIGYPIDRFLRHPDFAEAVRLAHEENFSSRLHNDGSCPLVYLRIAVLTDIVFVFCAVGPLGRSHRSNSLPM